MGAIGEAIVAYAQPLFEQTDGSPDEMNHAMVIAQMCWNLALVPEGKRDTALNAMQPALKMTDETFAEFRQHIAVPMIQRHCEMFPGMHDRSKQPSSTVRVEAPPTKKTPRTGRNAPCPCGSGRKHKLCCGASK